MARLTEPPHPSRLQKRPAAAQRAAPIPGSMRVLALLLVAAVTISPATASAGNADDQAIDAIEAFLHERVASAGGEVVIAVQPPAAGLPACPQPRPFLPRAGQSLLGRVSVAVRCGADGRDLRYLQAEISVFDDYPVLVEGVNAGTPITADSLTTRHGDLSQLPRDTVREPEALIGLVARRTVAAGVPLQLRQFRAERLVKRGQQVVVEARGNQFRATREGKALDHGSRGERVRVRLPNRETITGVVAGDGKVVVEF
jgi:flagella basal body P-ring formation protein FlgA